jgi:hypothetical protein
MTLNFFRIQAGRSEVLANVSDHFEVVNRTLSVERKNADHGLDAPSHTAIGLAGPGRTLGRLRRDRNVGGSSPADEFFAANATKINWRVARTVGAAEAPAQ